MKNIMISVAMLYNVHHSLRLASHIPAPNSDCAYSSYDFDGELKSLACKFRVMEGSLTLRPSRLLSILS